MVLIVGECPQRDRIAERLLRNREVNADGCWLWTRSCQPGGYGQTYFRRTNHRVHRVAAWLWLGFDPASPEMVLHRCDQPRCFNPDHLFVGSAADNTADMIAKGRHRLSWPREQSPAAKLTTEKVTRLREMRRQGLSYRALGQAFGVSHTAAREACIGETWR